MERLEVIRIFEEKLRELNLDNHYDIFCHEHNPLDGTHKESGIISPSSFNAPWVDVREEYGTSASAIQAAINSLDPGGTVFFPADSYLIDSTIVLKSGVSLIGVGGNSSKIMSGITDGSNLFETNATRVRSMRIADLYFSGTGSDGDCFNLHTFRRGNVIERVFILGFGGNGINLVQDCWQNTIKDSRIKDCYTGIKLGDQANIVRIKNVDFVGCASCGVDADAGAGNAISQLVLMGNDFGTCGTSINLGRVLGGTLIGNRIENSTTYAINLMIANKSINIISNYLQGNDITTEAITSSSSTGLNIMGNFIRSFPDYGIRLRNTDDYVYVINNHYDGTIAAKIGNARPTNYYISDPSAGVLETNISMIEEGGKLTLKEITTPAALANYGKIYCKADNKLYFQDGAGNEHTVAFV